MTSQEVNVVQFVEGQATEAKPNKRGRSLVGRIGAIVLAGVLTAGLVGHAMAQPGTPNRVPAPIVAGNGGGENNQHGGGDGHGGDDNCEKDKDGHKQKGKGKDNKGGNHTETQGQEETDMYGSVIVSVTNEPENQGDEHDDDEQCPVAPVPAGSSTSSTPDDAPAPSVAVGQPPVPAAPAGTNPPVQQQPTNSGPAPTFANAD